MKTHIGYKAVNRNLKSAVVGNVTSPMFMRPELVIRYSTEEWVSPPNQDMPIMVFNNYEAARKFVNNENDNSIIKLVIYKCEYIKSRKKWGWCIDRLDFCLKRKRQKKSVPCRLHSLPEGTELADKVLLLEEVSCF